LKKIDINFDKLVIPASDHEVVKGTIIKRGEKK
jgi:hypothetical protein